MHWLFNVAPPSDFRLYLRVTKDIFIYIESRIKLDSDLPKPKSFRLDTISFREKLAMLL